MITEKSERERSAWGMHKEKINPKPLAWKRRGVEFHEFLQCVALKTRVLKVRRLDWARA